MSARFPWRTATKIAWHEFRSSVGKFVFVIVAVALGVGALTGVRGFSRSFRAMLLTQARSLMAGDITLQVPANRVDTLAPLRDTLSHQAVRSTVITESLSMVAAPAATVPVLATIKAVDPAGYPFDGDVVTAPAHALATLDAQSALVATDLLLRLNLSTGGTISIGGQPFHIAAELVSEPDRLEGGIGIGPRLIVTHAGLDRTGIIQFGSQVQDRVVFKLGAASPPIDTVEATLRGAFPQSRMQDYRNVNPAVQQGLDHSTTFLSLISLMALIVGALGVACAMHAHLQLRLDSIATMKVLGARTSQIVRIYGVQTFLLGLAGGVCGVGLSAVIERIFPHLLAHFFPDLPALGWFWGPAGEGLACGILVTMLFTLPTLLGVRRIPPALIIRRYMSDSGQSWQKRAGRAAEMMVSALILFAGIALIAVALVDESWHDSLRVGLIFLLSLAVGIAVLAAATWLLLWVLRLIVRAGNAAGRLPVALRQGLANIYRPGSQAQPVLIALGIGVMFTLCIYLLQRSLLGDLQRSTPPGVANVFLVDVPPAQKAGVLTLLKSQPGLEHQPELLETVSARLTAVNGTVLPEPPARALPGRAGGEGRRGQDFGPAAASRGFRAAFRFQRAYSLVSEAEMPDGVNLSSGQWWTSTATAAGTPGIAVESEMADRIGLHPGDALTWEAGDRTFTAKVAAIYQTEPHRLISRAQFIVSPGPLAGLPTVVNGGVRVAPADIPQLEKELYALYPTVTVIDLAAVIERVQEVIDEIALVVHFVSFFAVLAGAIILASSVAGTRFRRMREIAVLKTFGATRGRIVRIFSTEFLVLGLVAGLTGSGLAVGFTNLITHKLLQVPFTIDWAPNLICIATTALVAVLAGWLASVNILQQKPLDVLRGE